MKLDEFLPRYDFNEIHKVNVNASPASTLAAVKELLPGELSPLVYWMLNLRELPARWMGKTEAAMPESKPFLKQLLEDGGFHLLAETDEEIVFGLIGQFWKLDGGPQVTIQDAAAFQAFERSDYAKVAANLAVQGIAGKTALSTETRIWAPDAATRRKFAFYWRLISMGSGWIRILWLRAIKRRAEKM